MENDKSSMLNSPFSVVFFGGRHVQSIAWQLKQSFNLELIVTTDSEMVNAANVEKIPFTQVLSIEDKFISEIEKLSPDLGVVADFGLIIPKKLIEIFPFGILNIHPSLLPKYRGSTPVQSAILNGDNKTGISIIKIDEELDHGPILYQEERIINPGDTTSYLLSKLFDRSAEVLEDVINNYVEETISLQIQDDANATYTKTFTKQDGFIDVDNPPEVEKLSRMINAFAPWPGVWTKYNLTSKEVVIKLLPNEEIQVEGKKSMTYKDFKNGYEKGEEFLKKLNLN
jgi:methionyl-tRNA formyltransferase